MNNLKAYFVTCALAGALYLSTAQTSFGQGLINGQFTNFTSLATTDSGTGGGLSTSGYAGDTLTGWTSTGYNFVFRGGNVGDVTVVGSGGALSLYGPANGNANGLVAPPGGGNIIANDGAYQIGPISQTVTGLTSGQEYAVSFEYAGAQQTTYTGTTTESWTVSLGGTAGAQTTSTLTNTNKGFTGWFSQTFDFTATGTTDVLSFLANGTPSGEPPFSLLADVSMTAVPEPKASACWMILFGMLILGGNRAWRWYQKRSSTNP